VGRDSAVRIATRYGLDDPGSNPGGKLYFPHPSRRAPRFTKPPKKWVPLLFLGAKRSGHGPDHPSASSAEANERVELIHLCAVMVYVRVKFTSCRAIRRFCFDSAVFTFSVLNAFNRSLKNKNLNGNLIKSITVLLP
jgi:hypothetical protein